MPGIGQTLHFCAEPLANFDCALQLGIIQHVLPWLAATRQPADVLLAVQTLAG